MQIVNSSDALHFDLFNFNAQLLAGFAVPGGTADEENGTGRF